MSVDKPRNTAARRAAEELAARVDANEPVETPEPPLNAVIIVKTEDEDGNIGVEIINNGNVQATETQTLIELALKAWRGKLGFV